MFEFPRKEEKEEEGSQIVSGDKEQEVEEPLFGEEEEIVFLGGIEEPAPDFPPIPPIDLVELEEEQDAEELADMTTPAEQLLGADRLTKARSSADVHNIEVLVKKVDQVGLPAKDL
eukprot:4837211-Ditylum_brightwellii.AAC.1